jgi:uncharacterized protein
MNPLDQFKKQKYLNLETFRRSGEGMKTPVWFVQDGEVLYVTTLAASGKAKRIRNNGRVNVAPCKVDGRLNGSWQPARARELTDPADSARVNRLLDRKYGLVKKLIDRRRAKNAAQDTVLEIRLEA